ncbi:MAG: ABC transporter ATP-binding protein [Thermaerobacter sp.]|nr:bacitracin ABC transporter ATP-binding protein [Bacillota bacterium]
MRDTTTRVLIAQGLTKIYGSRGRAVTRALNNLSLAVDRGEFVGIMGPSGSGKTTLLNLLATIDRPTSGTVTVEGRDTSRMSERELALFRRKRLGFVFQDFNLLDSLTLRENMALPLVLDRQPPSLIRQRVEALAQRLGIQHVLDRFPDEVSGGEQQRAAAGRAVIHEPALVLADEPTGNLDSRSSQAFMEILRDLNESLNVTIVMVTHDPFAASYCSRVLFIRDGALYNEIHRGDGRQAFFQQILDVLALLGGGSGGH